MIMTIKLRSHLGSTRDEANLHVATLDHLEVPTNILEEHKVLMTTPSCFHSRRSLHLVVAFGFMMAVVLFLPGGIEKLYRSIRGASSAPTRSSPLNNVGPASPAFFVCSTRATPFAKVPGHLHRKVFIDPQRGYTTLAPIFQSAGWTVVPNPSDAHMI